MPGKILVVDDDKVIRQYAVHGLSQDGLQVQEADSGQAALDILSQETFDVVLLDLHLDDIDGLTVMRQIKTRAPQTEVIIVTAYASVDSAVETMRLGAFDYLRKPVDIEKIVTCVNRALTHRRNQEVTPFDEAPGLPDLPQTKFQPPLLPTDFVPRPKLLTTFHQTITNHQLTLISAPAGYGKTTFLVDWLNHQKDTEEKQYSLSPHFHWTWLTLDHHDNDPVHFIVGLVMALRVLNPDFGGAAEAFLTAIGRPQTTDPTIKLEQLIGLLINDIINYIPHPFVLILSDYQKITEASIHTALDYFLARMPSQMRLVISSRLEPPLAIPRLRTQGEFAEIRLADLAFSQNETFTFLNDLFRPKSTRTGLTKLYQYTKGWPAGLRLLSAALKQLPGSVDRTEFITALTVSHDKPSVVHSEVFDYLTQEVLNHQPEDIRLFLLQTSILAELTPDLCRAVTGRSDAAAVLTEIHRSNLFLVATSEENLKDSQGPSPLSVYRYHDLFAGFLRHNLQLEYPDDVAKLHQRAAEAETKPERRIDHYLAANVWEQAAEIIEQVGERFLRQSLLDTVIGWIESLPASVQKQHPKLLYLLGVSAWQRNDLDHATKMLEQARQGFQKSEDDTSEGLVLVNLATCALFRTDFEQVTILIEEALTYPLLPIHRIQLLMTSTLLNMVQTHWEQAEVDFAQAIAVAEEANTPSAWRMLTTHLSPGITLLRGGLEQLEAICDHTLPHCCPPVDVIWQACINWQLAYLYWVRGNLEQALVVSRQVLAQGDQLGEAYLLSQTDTLMILALYHASQRNYKQANQTLARLFSHTNLLPMNQQLALSAYRYCQARIYWLQGDLNKAYQIYQQMLAIKDTVPLSPGPVLRPMLRGLLALSESEYETAKTALDEAANFETQNRFSHLFGNAHLLLANLYFSWGRPDYALAELSPVLDACEKANTPGLILQEGAIMIPLLRLAIQHNRHVAFANRLLTLFGEGVAIHNIPLTDDGGTLTRREAEILTLLAKGATNRAIAEKLDINLITVKSHITKLLRKLNVSSRTQAVARGRELGLIR